MKPYIDSLVGKECFYLLGPLHEAPGSRVKVFVKTEVEGLFVGVDTVEVEVKYGIPFRIFIFIHNAEGRRDGLLLNAELSAYLGDKGSLSSTHIAMEGEKSRIAGLLKKGPGHSG